MTLGGSWNVSFNPLWGGPDSVEFKELSDWSLSEVEGIRYYSGTAVYNKLFDLSEPVNGRVYLNLGNVKNIAKVTLNGHDLGTVWSAPWEIEITDALTSGENKLRIEVANLWVNRLIGDEQLPDDGIVGEQWPQWLINGEKRPSSRYTFTTYKHYSADSPLMPSGLLGPVKIISK